MSNKDIGSLFISRQAKLNQLLQSAGLDSMILNPGPSLVYLSGLHFHMSERPVLVIFLVNKAPIIVLPELELEKVMHLPFEIKPFPYAEDPAKWGDVFKLAAQSAGLDTKQCGVEPRQLRFLEYNLLSQAAPTAAFISAENTISKLRMYKDQSELSLMRRAAEIAQQALTATLPVVKIGITEKELASELTLQLLRAGCDPELPFTPIVSSGPNSANPHATPTDRKLSSGDLLVIDWGASFHGYFSDITRTFAISDLDAEFDLIGRLVLQANTDARMAAGPGVTADSVDRAARSVIESAGYGKYFTHRTGHGLGMEAHEDPYIREDNLQILESGMTFTIEPGIYLPGRNGVRIEDDVVVTSQGAESLTSFPREIRQLV